MVTKEVVLLLLAITGFVKGQFGVRTGPLGISNEFEVCWERCFQQLENTAQMEMFRPAFSELYDMGMEARRLKNMRSVNGTVFLLDSTLSDWHDADLNTQLQPDETGDAIWQFQRDLAIITSHMLGNDDTRNPATIIQFNEAQGWGCDTYAGLDQCQVADILAAGLTPIEMSETSDHDGSIEPACRLGFSIMHTHADTSGVPLSREMAIGFFNSDFHHHVHSNDHWDDYSPCDEHYDTRYPIGTHAVTYRELRSWSSLDAHPQYIRDNEYTIEAATDLSTCMNDACCGTVAPSTPTACSITTDHFGEEVEAFDHPAIPASA